MELRKVIHSADDLAINGARPMFAEALHVGRPNIGDRAAFLSCVGDILDRRWLSNNGPIAQELERSIASYLGVRNCVAMCNGTIALEIATRALGMEGEVVVPSYTFIATAHALQWQEITPIFADIDPATHNLDPDAVVRMLTPRTTGIIGVHLWGRPAPVEALQSIAEAHGLRLMFDASHGFGCTHKGRRIGSFGQCEVFSFHATKFFNTFEGGAVATNDDELAEKMRLMRNFGFAGYDRVIYPGTNGKITEIASAMGLVNLAALPSFVDANRRNYEIYEKGIAQIDGLSLLSYDRSEENNFQYIVIEVSPRYGVSRDRMVDCLHAENVLARKYFWPGCHNMEPYRAYYPNAGLLLPNTKAVADRVIVLPTGSTVKPADVEDILAILRAVPADGRSAPQLTES